MRLLHLQLALLAACCSVAAAGNKLLEDYERKLNSINDRLALKRPPGKHRWKRYRCIEEYVDEHGNVIEEGKEHVTTPAPVTTAPITKKGGKGHRVHGVKNTPVVIPGKTTATKGLKVTLVKKKRKPKPNRRGRVENRPSPTDSEALTRVYPTTTTTTSVAPTTEVIEEEDSFDDRILKKYFERPRGSAREQLTGLDDMADRMMESTTVPNTLVAPTLRPPLIEDTDVPDQIGDTDVTAEEETRPYRRHRNRGRVAAYSRRPVDYDVNYDDYNYVDDELPLVRRRLGRRRLRKYLAYPTVRYPGRREFTYTKVPPLPANYYATPRPAVFRPLVAISATPAAVRVLPPQKLQPLSLAPFREARIPPPPTPLPLSPAVPLPSPLPLATPPAQPPPLPLAAPPAAQTLQMEESTPETCKRMRRLAATFGISDISEYAQRNCRFLLTFAPGYSCEQIVHFVKSCDKNHFT